jgi:serine/threonine-protein kinase
MGVVYRALDLTLDRPVALKLLPPDLVRNADLRARFQAEAKAQANLNHPNIATVYGYIQDGDSAFIAMEYVEGETLEQRIRRAPIPPDEAVPFLQQALSGLGYARRMGIIQRDIKPANLMVNRQGTVKLLAFGLAKVLGAQRVTRSGIRVSVNT